MQTVTGRQVLEAIASTPSRQVLVFIARHQQSDYEHLFWRPFLGLPAYSLYLSLRSLAQVQSSGLLNSVSVGEIVTTLGQGTRETVLGHGKKGKLPARSGSLQTLIDHGLVEHWTKGSGREKKHLFKVLPTLPVLTAVQATKLPSSLKGLHEYFLGAFREFDLPGWRHLNEPSFVPLAIKQIGTWTLS